MEQVDWVTFRRAALKLKVFIELLYLFANIPVFRGLPMRMLQFGTYTLIQCLF